MFGLSNLGVIHTLISLVAVGAAVISFVRYKEILPRAPLGRLYIVTTVLTCLTALGIFRHGTFGPPHVLAILTLLVLAFAAAEDKYRFLGRASAAVVTISYSLTFLFHMIPAVTETTTRLPPGQPIFANDKAPGLQIVAALLFSSFVLGALLQLRLKRSVSATAPNTVSNQSA